MMDRKPGQISPAFLKKHLKQLLSSKYPIEAIYVYGSATRKERPSDIDILIIVNDTRPLHDKDFAAIERTSNSIKERAKKSGVEFHFQPVKLLSKWWHTLIEGEPWIISSLKNPIIIYDRKGVLKEVCGFIDKEHIYNREEKAERLLERSDYTAISNRRLLLGSINNLSNAGTEASQILLLFDGKFVLNKKAIAAELERRYVRTLGRDVVDTYTEIVDLEDKIAKGTMSEFSAENLDYYLDRLKIFISKVEEMLSKK